MSEITESGFSPTIGRRLLEAFLRRWKWYLTGPIRRRLGRNVLELDRRGYVFISNNCIAGQLYEMADLEKRSPTAGLYFANGAYGEFLEAIATGQLDSWARVTPDKLPIDATFRCPVWNRGANSTVVFLHYTDPLMAAHKWNTRFLRLKDRQPIVIATLRAGLGRDEMNCAKPRFGHFVIMEPSHGIIENDGLDRTYLRQLNAFLEGVLATTCNAS